MERKLASVQRVLEITPIEGADAIELARINGWQCVVKKGEFAVGDPGCYLEIDAIPPDVPVFRFLWEPKPKLDDNGELAAATWDGMRPDKYRIRTMRLRGALSQGLLLPMQDFQQALQQVRASVELDSEEPEGAMPDGFDVTRLLGVSKYEPPQAGGDYRAPFPGYVPQTDEMRVQSVPEVLDEMRGLPYTITEKVDGQSATYLIDRYDQTLHCCSRNRSVSDGVSSAWFNIARKYGIERALRENPTYALQGEIYGPGIQGNKLKASETLFAAFDVYDFGAARRLNSAEAAEFCARYGLPMVEVLETGESFDYDLAGLLARAEGKYPKGGEREGIVIRPRQETHSAALNGRLSFKAISNRFLLKSGE